MKTNEPLCTWRSLSSHAYMHSRLIGADPKFQVEEVARLPLPTIFLLRKLV